MFEFPRFNVADTDPVVGEIESVESPADTDVTEPPTVVSMNT